MVKHQPDTPEQQSDGETRQRYERGTLSQELILRTALEIVDSDGLEGLTVRKLAGRLGVTAMSIYRYYKSKAAIEHELVDLVVGDYDVTNHHEADWRDWICHAFLLKRHALCAHPGIIPLLDGATYRGSNAMAVMERVLGVMCQAGLSPEQAPQLFYMLMSYTIGSVVLMNNESRRAVAGAAEDLSELFRQRQLSFEMLPRGEYPNIVDLAPHLASCAEDEQFCCGVRQILAVASPVPGVSQ